MPRTYSRGQLIQIRRDFCRSSPRPAARKFRPSCRRAQGPANEPTRDFSRFTPYMAGIGARPITGGFWGIAPGRGMGVSISRPAGWPC
jgi:hypothetical protein